MVFPPLAPALLITWAPEADEANLPASSSPALSFSSPTAVRSEEGSRTLPSSSSISRTMPSSLFRRAAMLLGGLFLTGLGAYLQRSARDFLRQFVHGLLPLVSIVKQVSQGCRWDAFITCWYARKACWLASAGRE